MIHWFLPLPVVIRLQIRAFSKGWLEIGGGIQSFEKELLVVLIEGSQLRWLWHVLLGGGSRADQGPG